MLLKKWMLSLQAWIDYASILNLSTYVSGYITKMFSGNDVISYMIFVIWPGKNQPHMHIGIFQEIPF